jgi:PAS domain-containing protein
MEQVTRAILDLWQALAAEPDMGRLLTAVVRAAEVATGAAFGEIVLTNESWARLEYQFAQPAELALLENLRDRLGRRIIGVVTNAQATLQVEEPGHPGAGMPQSACHRGETITSSLPLPLHVEGNPLGLLTLFNKPGGFSADDREFMETFLGQITTTIERELMRVRLARIETRLQGIFEAIGDGLLVCDRHGKPLLANRAFRAMFFPPGQPNQALPAVLPPLLANPNDTGLQEVVLLKPHARVLSSSFVRTRDAQGKVQEMILSLRDITLSKRLDQRFLQLISVLIRRLDQLLTAARETARVSLRLLFPGYFPLDRVAFHLNIHAPIDRASISLSLLNI